MSKLVAAVAPTFIAASLANVDDCSAPVALSDSVQDDFALRDLIDRLPIDGFGPLGSGKRNGSP